MRSTSVKPRMISFSIWTWSKKLINTKNCHTGEHAWDEWPLTAPPPASPWRKQWDCHFQGETADRSSHSDSHIAQQNFLDGSHPFQFRHWEPRWVIKGKLFHSPPMSSTLKGLITWAGAALSWLWPWFECGLKLNLSGTHPELLNIKTL